MMLYSEHCVRKQKEYMKFLIRLKKTRKTFLLFLILAVTNFYAFSEPQKDLYEDIFFYAQKLQQGGALEQAELEYKRYIFMQDYSAGIYQVQAFEQLADLYASTDRWNYAVETIRKAILSLEASGDQDATDSHADLLRKKHILYLTKQAKAEKSNLADNIYIFSYINLPDFSDSIHQAASLAVFENLITNEYWKTAQDEFDNTVQNYPTLFTTYEEETIRTNLEKLNNFKPKKQMLAGYLSFFPGLGQLYAGDYKDSLNAFLLNGSIIALSVYSICTLDLWTFSLLEFDPLVRFMKGNIYNAQKDAYRYNTSHLSMYSKEIITVLENH